MFAVDCVRSLVAITKFKDTVQREYKSKMKLSAVTVLLAVSGASAYSIPNRASIRSLGQKTVVSSSGPRRNDASLKMEGTFL